MLSVQEQRLNVMWFLYFELAIIDSSDLVISSFSSFSFSSSSASARTPSPVSVLISPCTFSKSSFALLVYSLLLKPTKSSFTITSQISPLNNNKIDTYSSKFMYLYSLFSRTTYCKVLLPYYYSSCLSGNCCGSILHHIQWLPKSLLSILVRHRRRRRLFPSFLLSYCWFILSLSLYFSFPSKPQR